MNKSGVAFSDKTAQLKRQFLISITTVEPNLIKNRMTKIKTNEKGTTQTKINKKNDQIKTNNKTQNQTKTDWTSKRINL